MLGEKGKRLDIGVECCDPPLPAFQYLVSYARCEYEFYLGTLLSDFFNSLFHHMGAMIQDQDVNAAHIFDGLVHHNTADIWIQ